MPPLSSGAFTSSVAQYDIEYVYDQLGNRTFKYDGVAGLHTEYFFDTDLDPNHPNDFLPFSSQAAITGCWPIGRLLSPL